MRLTYRDAFPVLATAALLACGPKSSDTTDTATTDTATAGTTTDGATTAATTTPTPTTGPMNEPGHTRPSTEEQLCTDTCVNLIARDSGCSRADYTCFQWCMVGFEWVGDCRAEMRAARRCEAEATAFDGEWACETTECASVYAAFDVCNGWCSHLGGYPSSGGSPQECHWASDCLDGHSYEMECATGDAPQCSCRIDGAEAGTCQLATALDSFACDKVDLFGGCCNDIFLPVLKPAVIDEPIPSEPEPPGTASPGDPCPLVGLHLGCEQDGVAGRTFCDDIDGAVRFGPCIAAPDCDLLALACDGSCQLIDGVPTWVAEECMEGTSSG